jgi:tetratricopeptide (TPR) repeat protein
MGALLVFFSVSSSFCQVAPSQLVDRSSSGVDTVSRNQLLAPAKAIRAIERAHKDIIGGHLESAEKEIARALDIAPHFGAARAMEGAIDLQNGNFDAASKSFQQAIEDDPVLAAAYLGMSAILIHQMRFQAALPLLDRAEGLSPSAWMIHYAKAWTEIEIGNSEAALSQADIADSIAGKDAKRRSGVSYLRAMLSIRLNHTDAAREYLAETIARDPGGDYAALARKDFQRLQPLLAAGR